MFKQISGLRNKSRIKRIKSEKVSHGRTLFLENCIEREESAREGKRRESKVKIGRAYGGCLGAKRRRRARLTAKCHGKP